MEETNIHNGDNSTIVSKNEKNIIPIEVVPEFEPTTLIVANPRNGKFSKLGNWVKKWREVTIQKFRANYAKRNVITNVILTLYFLMSIVMTILYLFVSFAVTLGEPFIFGIFISAFLIPHILFLLHAYQFVILNWKEAVYKSYVSLFFSLIPYTMMYIVLNVPEPEEGASEGGDIVASAIMALFIILFVVGIVSIALRFKKYGASAKMLLDIPRDKSRKMFNYKTYLSVLAFCVCQLINVILSTLKSVITIKGGKGLAAISNAVAYGFNTIVIKDIFVESSVKSKKSSISPSKNFTLGHCKFDLATSIIDELLSTPHI